MHKMLHQPVSREAQSVTLNLNHIPSHEIRVSTLPPNLLELVYGHCHLTTKDVHPLPNASEPASIFTEAAVGEGLSDGPALRESLS